MGIGTIGGATLGAAASGAGCYKLTKGSGYELVAALGCSVIGGTIGAFFGHQWDKKDEQEAANIFNTYADGDIGSWKNPDTQNNYSITPVSTFQNDQGQQCRQFELVINGKPNEKSQVCKNKETGRWKLTTI
jgi:surface antigen